MSNGYEIGPGTDMQPAPQGPSDPGDVYRYGPHFVSFVRDRFAAVETVLARAIDVMQKRGQVEGFRQIKSGETDASGNLTLELFQAQPNQKFALHRIYIHAVGYTWKTPYQGAGEVLIQTDSMPWSGGGLNSGQSPGQLPAVFSVGRLQAVEAQDGERLTLQINTGPVSTRIECRCQGVLTTVYGDDR